MNATYDAGRIALMLNELRLPTIGRLWPDFAERSDKESWQASRLLGALLEHRSAVSQAEPEPQTSGSQDLAVPAARSEDRAQQPGVRIGHDIRAYGTRLRLLISKAHVMALAAGDSWLEKGATILLFGPPGHETYETLAAITATRTTAQWLDLLRDADIPHSEVVSFDALFEDEHLKATGLFYTYEHPTEGKLRGVGIPTRFSRTPGSIRLFPSALTSSSKGQPSEEKQQ